MPTRVLLADFDKWLANHYAAYLHRSGFEVATARNGLQCLEQLRTFRPDILVLEPCILWGGGSGVLELIARDATLPSAQVIILTSGQDREEVRLVLNYQIADYHPKPLLAPRLLESIYGVLRIRDGQRSTATHSQGPAAQTAGSQ